MAQNGLDFFLAMEVSCLTVTHYARPGGERGGGNEWGMGHFPEDISVTASGSEWLKVEVKKAMGWEGTPREDGNQEHAARPVPIELPNCKLLPGVLIIF